MAESKPIAVSEELREAVRDSGYTQYELWKATGVQQSVISRFMRGKGKLSLTHVDHLAAFLGLRLVPEWKVQS